MQQRDDGCHRRDTRPRDVELMYHLTDVEPGDGDHRGSGRRREQRRPDQQQGECE